MKTLPRSEFNAACKALLSLKDTSGSVTYPERRGWEWREHELVKDYGYLAKRVRRLHRPPVEQEIDTEEDPAALEGHEQAKLVGVDLSIVYSASFRMPVLYFVATDAGGVTLTLDALLASGIFRAGRTAEYPLTQPQTGDGAAYPTISVGEHPISGQHSFYLHPCNTSTMVEEVLSSFPPDKDPSLATLQTWLMIVHNLLDLG